MSKVLRFVFRGLIVVVALVGAGGRAVRLTSSTRLLLGSTLSGTLTKGDIEARVPFATCEIFGDRLSTGPSD